MPRESLLLLHHSQHVLYQKKSEQLGNGEENSYNLNQHGYAFDLYKVTQTSHSIPLARRALQSPRSYVKATYSCEKPQMLKKNQAQGLNHLSMAQKLI